MQDVMWLTYPHSGRTCSGVLPDGNIVRQWLEVKYGSAPIHLGGGGCKDLSGSAYVTGRHIKEFVPVLNELLAGAWPHLYSRRIGDDVPLSVTEETVMDDITRRYRLGSVFANVVDIAIHVSCKTIA